MNVRRLDISEYTKLFNERCFNPPGERTAESEKLFAQEFDHALNAVQKFCSAEFTAIPEGESEAFHVWPYYNWSRVISVEMTTDDFLRENVVVRLQAVLSSLPQAWTVILNFSDTLFVSSDQVLAFIYDPYLVESVDIDWINSARGPNSH